MADNDMNNPELNPLAELDAMRAVAGALEKLDATGRGRVLDWAIKFYRASPSLGSGIQNAPTEVAGSSGVGAGHAQQDLANLFAATQPGSDTDKALVAAYFLATVTGVEEFDAFSINSELTHLGHRVGNITRALVNLTNTRPALVVQTRKEGKTQQARKKFKITVEGRRRVEQMQSAANSRVT